MVPAGHAQVAPVPVSSVMVRSGQKLLPRINPHGLCGSCEEVQLPYAHATLVCITSPEFLGSQNSWDPRILGSQNAGDSLRGHFGGHFFLIFSHFSNFFGPVPGVFPGALGTMEWSSREVLGVFLDTFLYFFGSCWGRSPGIFPVLPDVF